MNGQGLLADLAKAPVVGGYGRSRDFLEEKVQKEALLEESLSLWGPLTTSVAATNKTHKALFPWRSFSVNLLKVKASLSMRKTKKNILYQVKHKKKKKTQKKQAAQTTTSARPLTATFTASLSPLGFGRRPGWFASSAGGST